MTDSPMTPAQKRVLAEAIKIDDWFIFSQMYDRTRCQIRTLNNLIRRGFIKRSIPAGGPPEYLVTLRGKTYGP